MTIFFYKGLTRNPGIGNTPIWVLPIFGTNVSNKILLNVSKCQSYNFYYFRVVKGKSTGGGGLPLRPTHIRIKMIKICDKSLLQPLILLFHNSVKSSCYPDIWKRFNIITVHKKSDKQLVGNYRLISILPMFVKIF